MLEKLRIIYSMHKVKSHFILILIGILLFVLPPSLEIETSFPLLTNLSFVLGAAFITSSIIFFIIGDSHDAVLDEHRKLFSDLYEKSSITQEANGFGLCQIVFPRSNLCFKDLFDKVGIKNIDICGVTLKTPLYSMITSGRMLELLESGANVRVLLSHPESSYLSARMKSEENHSLKANVESVILRLVDLIQTTSDSIKGSLDVNYFDGSKDSFYLRIDDLIYVYGYSFGQDASNEPVFIYKFNSIGGNHFTKTFNKKWEVRSHLSGEQRLMVFLFRDWLKDNWYNEYDNLNQVLNMVQRFSLERNGCPASAELCLAALAHDVERCLPHRIVKPNMDPSSADYDSEYEKYKLSHQHNSRDKFIELSTKLGINSDLSQKASILIADHDIPSGLNMSTDLEILRAADGYVFFLNDIKKYREVNGEQRLRKKAKFMWRFTDKDVLRHPELLEYKRYFEL